MKLLLAVLIIALTPQFAQAQGGDSARPEQVLLRLANQARAEHGLPPLHWDEALAHAAQAHLEWMMRTPGELLHQYPGEPDLTTRASQAGARFSIVSENLGARGEDPAHLQQKWMSTAVHRATLLNPQLDRAGIAVMEKQGLLYAVEDFSSFVPVERTEDLERQISGLLQARGIAPAESNQDARRTCDLPKGAAGNPKLVVQWDGPHPAALPDVLLQQLASGRYTSAGVGVCQGQQDGQFTTYHVAVLLY